jgi:hypothetical protein
MPMLAPNIRTWISGSFKNESSRCSAKRTKDFLLYHFSTMLFGNSQVTVSASLVGLVISTDFISSSFGPRISDEDLLRTGLISYGFEENDNGDLDSARIAEFPTSGPCTVPSKCSEDAPFFSSSPMTAARLRKLNIGSIELVPVGGVPESNRSPDVDSMKEEEEEDALDM